MRVNYVQAQYSTASARAMLRGWIADHRGDLESVARYMRDTLRIGGIRVCRQLIAEALEEEFPQADAVRIIRGIGGKAFPADYNWECPRGHENRSWEQSCYSCETVIRLAMEGAGAYLEDPMLYTKGETLKSRFEILRIAARRLIETQSAYSSIPELSDKVCQEDLENLRRALSLACPDSEKEDSIMEGGSDATA